MKKKAARAKSPAPKKSFLQNPFDNKYRHIHGATAGGILVLMHSIWAIFAVIGAILLALSAFSYFTGKSKKS